MIRQNRTENKGHFMAKKKILIAGSSGLIGTALVPFLEESGFHVGRLLRKPNCDQPSWDIDQASFDLKDFEQPDIVINLAGENIAAGRWTVKRKKVLIDSRMITTTLLAEHFSKGDFSPELFINASAIGFYGTKCLSCDEKNTVGDDFTSQLSNQWEKACSPLEKTDTRLVKIRTGIVLSPNGGALTKMLPAFKLGVGGKIAEGNQIMSWIDLTDFCRAILHIINNPSIKEAINLTAPNAVSNQRFSEALAQQLKRPCLFPIPAFMIKLLFGDMGKELLLTGCAVQPKKLIDAGFKFEFETIEKSLKHQLS